MKRVLIALSLLSIAAVWLIPANAAAPVKVDGVAPAGDLAAEAEARIADLEGYLENESTFSQAVKSHSIAQDAGVLACLAQALAEHGAKDGVKIAAPALRDAALALRDSKTLAEAKQAMEKVKQAQSGKASGDAAVEHPWNKLIGMHEMMEEINSRNASLRRVIRRPRNPEKDSLHASTLAVLGLAMRADTHEVKNKGDLPEWESLAETFQQNMTQLADAMKKKDTAAAREHYLNAAKSCNACHQKFREE